MKYILVFILSAATVLLLAGSCESELSQPAPEQLPGITQDMQSASYWISRHPSPDALVMDREQIEAFNKSTLADGLVLDLGSFPPIVSSHVIKNEIEALVTSMQSRDLFKDNGTQPSSAFYDEVLHQCSLGVDRGSVDVRYAVVTAFANERLLPTEQILTAKPGDILFDEVQNSGLDLGTPVVVLQESKSGKWLFVKDEIAEGWVKSDTLAFVSRKEFFKRLKAKKFAVVVNPKAMVYTDRAMTEVAGVVRMGMPLSYLRADKERVIVTIPKRQPDGHARFVEAYMKSDDVNVGFLPYTARTILTQAFKMQGLPYGWGDFNGEQDCSRFLQMVFATVGIKLPRNSGEQGKTGTSLARFEPETPNDVKAQLLSQKAPGGQTILRLKGHVMLYLGEVDGAPYAIHDVWAYREKTESGDVARIIGKVAVTDLFLGQGSSKGSLLDRLLNVKVIQAPGK